MAPWDPGNPHGVGQCADAEQPGLASVVFVNDVFEHRCFESTQNPCHQGGIIAKELEEPNITALCSCFGSINSMGPNKRGIRSAFT